MISIVVPVYNVENYLDKCVQSLMNQTYRDIEILLIDDGATDGSGKMCDEYALKDRRIKAYHKENGGLSDARNYGMERAKGEYISFIDSDDYVEPDMMEFLISSIGDADMATCGVYNDYASGSSPQYGGEEKTFETDGIEAFKLILEGKLIPGAIWNKLIKYDIAKQIEFPFGKRYEDIFYTNRLMSKLNKVRVNTRPLYHYIHRSGSITSNPFSRQDMDIIEGYEETKSLFSQHGELEYFVDFRVMWAHFTVLDKMLMLDDYEKLPEYERVLSFLKKNAFKAMKTKAFTKGRRIAALALKVNVKLYRILLMKNEDKNKRLYD